MMPTPAYSDVVEMFDIGALRKPGDLVIVNGDLAMHDGDLMLGGPHYNALYRLVQGWRFHAPALDALCDIIFDAPQRRERAEDEMNGLSLARAANRPTDIDPAAVERFHALDDEIGSDELGMSAYAGTIFVVLGELAQRFRRDINASEQAWLSSGPLIAGQAFGPIVVAAGNNFRHHDEWRRTRPPNRQQERSQSVLHAVLSCSERPRPFLNKNVCEDVATVLAGGRAFIGISTGLFEFAKAMT